MSYVTYTFYVVIRGCTVVVQGSAEKCLSVQAGGQNTNPTWVPADDLFRNQLHSTYSRASIIRTPFIRKVVYPNLKSEYQNFETLNSHRNLGPVSCESIKTSLILLLHTDVKYM